VVHDRLEVIFHEPLLDQVSQRRYSMNSDHPSNERRRSEPEIIPPDRTEPRSEWTSFNERGTHRIYVTRLGPISAIILVLALAGLVAVLLLVLIGTFLIWIPLVALLIAAALISAWWQRIFRGFR
jgi:Flp pilus assembly protein TadB